MEPFKNAYSPQLVSCIADHLHRHIAAFDSDAFSGPILEQLEQLELKERAQLIADTIHAALPDDHQQRSDIVLATLHPDEVDHANGTSDADGICGWGSMPLTMMVGQRWVDDFDRAMAVQKELTKRGSSEFGVRYFLLADQQRALQIMRGWINDPNRHVRRLISEGSRPRLPWTMQLPQLIEDPSPMIPILTALRDDEEEYVRRSVANHLNDIAKDHPDMIADLAVDWMRGADKHRQKLVRHACRTLIKQGHPRAMEAIGVSAPSIDVEALTVATATVVYGNSLDFSATLKSTSAADQSLIIDYLIHFRKANGQLAAKVFKGSKMTLPAGKTHIFKKSHPIRPITTRRYYGGQQGLSLRINGNDFGNARFDLVMPENA